MRSNTKLILLLALTTAFLAREVTFAGNNTKCADEYIETTAIGHSGFAAYMCFSDAEASISVKPLKGMVWANFRTWACGLSSGECFDDVPRKDDGTKKDLNRDTWYSISDREKLHDFLRGFVEGAMVIAKSSVTSGDSKLLSCASGQTRKNIFIAEEARDVCFFPTADRPIGLLISGMENEREQVGEWCCGSNGTSLAKAARREDSSVDTSEIWFAVPDGAPLRPKLCENLGCKQVGTLAKFVDWVGEHAGAVLLLFLVLAVLCIVGWKRQSKEGSRRKTGNERKSEAHADVDSSTNTELLGRTETIIAQFKKSVFEEIKSGFSDSSWIKRIAKEVAHEIRLLIDLERASARQKTDPRTVLPPPSVRDTPQADYEPGARGGAGVGTAARASSEFVYVTEAPQSGTYSQGLRFSPVNDRHGAVCVVETHGGGEGRLKPNLDRGDWHPKWNGLFGLTSANWRSGVAGDRSIPVQLRDGYWVRR